MIERGDKMTIKKIDLYKRYVKSSKLYEDLISYIYKKDKNNILILDDIEKFP